MSAAARPGTGGRRKRVDEASVLEAARESTLSDDDLYPLLARL